MDLACIDITLLISSYPIPEKKALHALLLAPPCHMHIHHLLSTINPRTPSASPNFLTLPKRIPQRPNEIVCGPEIHAHTYVHIKHGEYPSRCTSPPFIFP